MDLSARNRAAQSLFADNPSRPDDPSNAHLSRAVSPLVLIVRLRPRRTALFALANNPNLSAAPPLLVFLGCFPVAARFPFVPSPDKPLANHWAAARSMLPSTRRFHSYSSFYSHYLRCGPPAICLPVLQLRSSCAHGFSLPYLFLLATHPG